MRREHWRWVIALAIALAGAMAARPATAGPEVGTDQFMQYSVDSTQKHPKSEELLFASTKPYHLTSAVLGYSVLRHQQGDESQLKARGKLIVSLELLRGEQTLLIGRRAVKVWKSPNGTLQAFLAFIAPSTDMAYWDSIHSADPDPVVSQHLPVDLQPGDLLVWSVKFKGRGKLEFKPGGTHPYRDIFLLYSSLGGCGTAEVPCIDSYFGF